MKVTTAIALVLTGVAVLLLRPGSEGRRPMIGRGLGLIVAAVGGVVMFEWVIAPVGIDHVLIREGTQSFAGRPSPHTAVALIVIGLTIATVRVGRVPRWVWTSLWLSAAAVVLVALVGYLYRVDYLTGVAGVSGMAIHTLVALVVLVIAVAALAPDRGPAGWLCARDATGRIGRAMVPVAVLGPPAAGGIAFGMQELGWLGMRVGLSVFTFSMVTLLLIVVRLLAVRAGREERALREAEQRFRGAFASSGIGIALIAPDGRWLEVNPAFCAIVGYSERELLASSFQAITHPQDLAADLALLERMVAREIDSHRTSKRYVRKSGRPVWAELNVSSVLDMNGRVAYFVSQVQDVTAARQAQAALIRNEARLRAFVEHSPAAIVLRDLEGRYEYVNHETAAALGHAPHELIGRSSYESHPAQIAAAIRAEDERMLRDGTRVTMRAPVTHPDGSEHVYEVTKYPVLGEDNTPVGLGSFALDITERLTAQEALLERKRQLAEAQRIARLGTWEWHLSEPRAVLSEEACRVLGQEPGFAPSYEDFRAMIHPEDRPRLDERIAGGDPLQAGDEEARIVLDRGEVRYVHVRSFARTGPDGEASMLFGTVQDITERRLGEEQIRENERRLAEAQSLAHIGSWELDLATDRLRWSDELCRIFGQPTGFSPRYDEFLALVHPDDRAAIESRVQDAKASRFSDTEYRIIRPDGEIRYLHTRRFARADRGRTLTHLWGTSQDITERRHAELAVHRAREHAEAITAAMAEGYGLTVDGRIVTVNDALCQMTGFSRQELIGMRAPYPFWPPETVEQSTAVRDRVVGQQGDTFELTLMRKHGERFDAELTARAARNPDGSVLGYVTTFRDISERKRREAEQRALHQIAELVAQAAGPAAVFEHVARHVLELFNGHSGLVARFDEPARRATVVNGATHDGTSLTGTELDLDGSSAPATVYRTGTASRTGGARTTGLEPRLTAVVAEISDAVAAPIVVAGRLWGCLGIAFSGKPGPADTEERLARFAELVAMAVANAEAWDALARQASTDAITGLANHRSFKERLGPEVTRARRYRRALSLVLLDIDHFKQVNDTHGHQTGDEVLAEVGRRLAAQAREGELVARIGGEEFAWLMPEADGHGAYQAAERARRAIESEPFPGVGTLTVSAGICASEDDLDGEDLIRFADRALYWAKDSGRNTTFLYTDEADALLSRGITQTQHS
jgi:diguanylate cyclase (GGDEF)-like protein/PAS domain S-box-containing protein